MWAQVVNTLLGLWLMAAPAVLQYGGAARTNDHIIGPIVASIAAIAVANVTRGLRWCNVGAGAWLLIAPWLLDYPVVPTVNSLVMGILLVAFSLVRGKVKRQFGGGWKMLLPGQPVPQEQGAAGDAA